MTTGASIHDAASAVSRLALGLAVVAIVGCEGNPLATPDPFVGWSGSPLAPDPALAARVLRGDTACNLDPASGPMRILVQDRRMPMTAAFLVASTTAFGSCTVTSSGGPASGSSGPMPGPMVGRLTIDHNGRGSLFNGNIYEIGGRAGPGIARVMVQIADEQKFQASLANGYWLAWWPYDAPVVRVAAIDSTGHEIAAIEVPK